MRLGTSWLPLGSTTCAPPLETSQTLQLIATLGINDKFRAKIIDLPTWMLPTIRQDCY